MTASRNVSPNRTSDITKIIDITDESHGVGYRREKGVTDSGTLMLLQWVIYSLALKLVSPNHYHIW